MKKLIFIIFTFLIISCGDETPVNNCFQGIRISEIINLNNAEFVDIQVAGGYSITNLSGRNIIIIRRTSSQYKVFDLQCPEGNCNSSMTFDGLKLKCQCSEKEYNSLNGTPLDGVGCPAMEYTAQVNGNTLIISR